MFGGDGLNLAWAAAEYRSLDLGDVRLARRAVQIMAAMLANPDQSLPQLVGGKWADVKAAYRFCDNPHVSDDALLKAHRDATVRRIGDKRLVLAAQDTTVLTFTGHPRAAATMGPIGAVTQRQKGFFLHSAMAVDPDTGEPLGLLASHMWSRALLRRPRSASAAAGALRRRRTCGRRARESQRWLTTMTDVAAALPAGTKAVMVSDRESDIYEYVDLAVAAGHEVLLRATHDRELTTGRRRLHATLARSAPLGRMHVAVPRADGQPGRMAVLALRVAQVELAPPKAKQGRLRPRIVTAILASEEHAPARTQAIHWLLLTTLPVPDAEAAARCVRWYTYRWRIERFHYVLKSGCHVERLQLQHLQRIRRALALFLPVASRLLQLTYAARSRPQAPCTELLSADEWRALGCYVFQKPTPPATPPDLHTAVRWIAQLGGFLARKGDGEPGVKVLWRGLRLVPAITRMWRVMQQRQ